MKRFFAVVLVSVLTVGNALGATPVDVLKAQHPALYSLYMANGSYSAALTDYANRQGFRRPFENLGTVVHEMIHIASAVHQGFFIEGIYYEPYLKPGTWSALTNNEVRSYMGPEERGTIYSLYVLNTPGNNLGNVLDEINAYSHVAEFICRNEPESGEKQMRNLIGHLNLHEAYLRVMRLGMPRDYMRISNSREARGAITAIVTRAVAVLRNCGVPQTLIPVKEANYFLMLASAVVSTR